MFVVYETIVDLDPLIESAIERIRLADVNYNEFDPSDRWT